MVNYGRATTATDRIVAPDSIAVGPAAREKDPPNTVAIFGAVAEGRSSVALSTKDGPQGSGVAHTYYMLQGETGLASIRNLSMFHRAQSCIFCQWIRLATWKG